MISCCTSPRVHLPKRVASCFKCDARCDGAQAGALRVIVLRDQAVIALCSHESLGDNSPTATVDGWEVVRDQYGNPISMTWGGK